MKNLKEERLGTIKNNKESLGGYKMKIVEYNGKDDITVEFQDEYNAKVHTGYNNFKKGDVKNPYHPSVYRVGYLGQGKYNAYKNKKQTDAYNIWQRMLQRCYDPYTINKYLTYIDCYVCEEWHCFQNFAEWFYKHKYECNDRLCLDKDVLIKGNKIYSPKTCVLVPQRINNLFVKSDAIRGEYLIGVHWDKNANKFISQCSTLDKNGKKKMKYLGLYDNEYEAFLSYKRFKEKYIKQIANEYKDIIPQKLYDAMYRYEVEIND